MNASANPKSPPKSVYYVHYKYADEHTKKARKKKKKG